MSGSLTRLGNGVGVHSGTKVVSYQRFDLALYPGFWNENFVKAKSIPNQNPESLVEEVVAAASQLRLSKLAWRVSSSPDSRDLERVLEDAGFVAEKMDELLAWELGNGPAPILPEPEVSGQVIAERGYQLRALSGRSKSRGCGLWSPTAERAGAGAGMVLGNCGIRRSGEVRPVLLANGKRSDFHGRADHVG
jgi:hypothetical protein